MRNLETRVSRLEGKGGGSGSGPAVVLMCDAVTGEPGGALFRGGGVIVRNLGEVAAAFVKRAHRERAQDEKA